MTIELNNALLEAAACGNAPECRRLLSLGADANALSHSRRPLHNAVSARFLEIVDLLIDAGAAIDGQADCGSTPLHFAAADGDPVMTRHLLDCGADLHAANSDGDTPLHRALRFGLGKSALVLLQAGADLERANHLDKTPRDLIPTMAIRDLVQAWDARQAALSALSSISSPGDLSLKIS